MFSAKPKDISLSLSIYIYMYYMRGTTTLLPIRQRRYCIHMKTRRALVRGETVADTATLSMMPDGLPSSSTSSSSLAVPFCRMLAISNPCKDTGNPEHSCFFFPLISLLFLLFLYLLLFIIYYIRFSYRLHMYTRRLRALTDDPEWEWDRDNTQAHACRHSLVLFVAPHVHRVCAQKRRRRCLYSDDASAKTTVAAPTQRGQKLLIGPDDGKIIKEKREKSVKWRKKQNGVARDNGTLILDLNISKESLRSLVFVKSSQDIYICKLIYT